MTAKNFAVLILDIRKCIVCISENLIGERFKRFASEKIANCNNCKYELRMGLIILGHFYDKKCLKPLIYKGLSQTTYN